MLHCMRACPSIFKHVIQPAPTRRAFRAPRNQHNPAPWRRHYNSQSPLLPQPDPSAAHTSLTTFLSHAQRTSLSPTSPTYLGTRYEYLTQTHLSTHLGFELARVGGRGDSGIDLLGLWPLSAILRSQTQTQRGTPSEDEGVDAIRVLVQCKRVSRAGPSLVRELEGSFRGAPSAWRGENVLGVMVCSSAATKGVRDAMGRSSRGLVWVMLEEGEDCGLERVDEAEDGAVERTSDGDEGSSQSHGLLLKRYVVPQTRMRQFLFNAAAASRCGLNGLNVGMRHDNVEAQSEVQLLWQAKPIRFN